MASARPHPLSLAFPIVAVGLAADDADARFTYGGPYCDSSSGYSPTTGIGYCDTYDILQDLFSSVASGIPTDGVVLLQAAVSGDWSPGFVANVDASVTQDGAPIVGALEPTDLPGWLIWRPQDPLVAGTTYKFAATIFNPDVPAACVPAEIAVGFDFTAVSVPAAPLVSLVLNGIETVQQTPIVELDSLACCPDVAPTQNMDPCTDTVTVDFDPESCTPLSASGALQVDLTGTVAAPVEPANHVLYELLINGSVWSPAQPGPELNVTVLRDKPFCASVRAHDLATGTSVDGPLACFGDEVVGELGVHAIAPPDSFTCSLRQCEIDGNTWDLDACTPLDPDHPNEPEPEKGCGCASEDPSGGLGLLTFAGLLVASRRRSRRPGRPG